MENLKSCIYKIYCKDQSINDIYIGSTKNFNNRKNNHKSDILNLKNLKVYNTINNLGGFDNWIIEAIEFINDISQLKIKEREYVDTLKPTLNIRRPYLHKNENYIIHKSYFQNYYKNYRNNKKMEKLNKLENINNQK